MREAVVLDGADIRRAMARVSHEILERHRGVEDLSIVGIRSGGVWLAEILVDALYKISGQDVGLAVVDTRRVRDDSPRVGLAELAAVQGGIGSRIVLVDDVIQTGRTARAAMEAVLANVRPRSIRLAVLVDRGHRELPICPDFVGKNLPSALSEYVSVSRDGVVIHG